MHGNGRLVCSAWPILICCRRRALDHCGAAEDFARQRLTLVRALALVESTARYVLAWASMTRRTNRKAA